MTITNTIYGGFLQSLAAKQINLTADTFKVMLLGSGYTPADTHRYVSDLGANEIAGTGYTAGGATLSGVTAAYAANTLTFNANDVSWANSTITAYYAAVYDSTPATAATQPLICIVSFGAAESDTNGTFQITWNAAGIAQISHT